MYTITLSTVALTVNCLHNLSVLKIRVWKAQIIWGKAFFRCLKALWTVPALDKFQGKDSFASQKQGIPDQIRKDSSAKLDIHNYSFSLSLPQIVGLLISQVIKMEQTLERGPLSIETFDHIAMYLEVAPSLFF